MFVEANVLIYFDNNAVNQLGNVQKFYYSLRTIYHWDFFLFYFSDIIYEYFIYFYIYEYYRNINVFAGFYILLGRPDVLLSVSHREAKGSNYMGATGWALSLIYLYITVCGLASTLFFSPSIFFLFIIYRNISITLTYHINITFLVKSVF